MSAPDRRTRPFPRGLVAITALLVLATATPGGAEVRLDIVGVTGALEENVRHHVGRPPGDEARLVARFARRAPELAREGLEALGHYEARIEASHQRVDRTWVVTLEIDPGEPVRLATVDIRLLGEAGEDEGFRRATDGLPLRPGDQLHHGRYEFAKRVIENTAAARGYFDGQFVANRITVAPLERSADVILHYESGARYRMGEVRFPELPLSQRLLDRLVPFEPGDPYSAEQVARLDRHLRDTDYFKSVRVLPQRDEAGDDRRVPVDVELEMRARNLVGLGVGFATDVGPRGRLSWKRPWVRAEGHSVEFKSELSEVRQELGAEYEIPLDPPLQERIHLFGGVRLDRIEDTRSDRFAVGAERRRTRPTGWQQTLFLRLEREQFTQAGVRGRSTLALPGIRLERTRTRGGIDPYWGDRQLATLELAHRDFASDISLARVRLRTEWLRSLGDLRLTGRLELGALTTDGLDQTPPSLRFFAGGDHSIRGFAYQSIGPRDEEDRLVGGRFLAIGSLEASVPVVAGWRLAAFFDAGNAFAGSDLSGGLARGAGAGIRWVSPVAPVRLDFAWGISEPDPPFRIHLSLAPAL